MGVISDAAKTIRRLERTPAYVTGALKGDDALTDRFAADSACVDMLCVGGPLNGKIRTGHVVEDQAQEYPYEGGRKSHSYYAICVSSNGAIGKNIYVLADASLAHSDVLSLLIQTHARAHSDVS